MPFTSMIYVDVVVEVKRKVGVQLKIQCLSICAPSLLRDVHSSTWKSHEITIAACESFASHLDLVRSTNVVKPDGRN